MEFNSKSISNTNYTNKQNKALIPQQFHQKHRQKNTQAEQSPECNKDSRDIACEYDLFDAELSPQGPRSQMRGVSLLVGTLSLVNHNGLHQG